MTVLCCAVKSCGVIWYSLVCYAIIAMLAMLCYPVLFCAILCYHMLFYAILCYPIYTLCYAIQC